LTVPKPKSIIANGTVYLDHGPEPVDLLIANGEIAEIGKRSSFPSDIPVVDATGFVVLPGMIDFHVHLDDTIGGRYLADTYLSGSKAAVLNGITTLFSFVTQAQGSSLRQAVAVAQSKVCGKSYCDVGFHLTPITFSDGDWDDIQSFIGGGYRTFKFYTTYKAAGLYQSYAALRELLKRFEKLNARVLVHCEDEMILAASPSQSQNVSDPISHTFIRPPAAEIEAIYQVAKLASETGARVHIVHVSTASGARIIQEKRSEADLSCETAPHYLWLNDSVLHGQPGQRYLCSPPLRDEQNRSELEMLAADGAIDIFATDHCAFSAADKNESTTDIRNVPNGIAGIGALVPLMHELIMTQQHTDWSELVLRLSKRPAELAGVYPRKGSIRIGADADLVLLSDTGAARPIRSSYSDSPEPYPKRTTTLDMRYVFVRGELIVKDNQLVQPERPTGQVLWPI
jgi:dihydropyrimidinase